MASEATISPPALLGRLYWMIVGPFALAICATRITESVGGWLGPLDMVYFLLLGGVLVGRWLEFRHSQPTTAMGEPATVSHLRRYTVVASFVGLGIWVAAKLVANQATHSLG